jgi:hypothetical protein
MRGGTRIVAAIGALVLGVCAFGCQEINQHEQKKAAYFKATCINAMNSNNAIVVRSDVGEDGLPNYSLECAVIKDGVLQSTPKKGVWAIVP